MMKKHKKIIAVTAAVMIDVLRRQEYLLRKIAMNQDELLVAVNAANAKTEKIIGEIMALKSAIENASEVSLSPEVEAAIAQLTSNLQVADDLNADAATEEPAV